MPSPLGGSLTLPPGFVVPSLGLLSHLGAKVAFYQCPILNTGMVLRLNKFIQPPSFWAHMDP
jgi:hypothetical protein